MSSGIQFTRLPNRPRNRLRRTQTAHNLDASIKRSFEFKRTQENQININAIESRVGNLVSSSDNKKYLASTKESSSHTPLSPPSSEILKSNSNTDGNAFNSSKLSKNQNIDQLSIDAGDPANNFTVASIPQCTELCQQEKDIQNIALKQQQQYSSSTSTDNMTNSRFRIGRRASTISRTELRQREAMWDLFQSENAFLIDHLMVLKHVSRTFNSHI